MVSSLIAAQPIKEHVLTAAFIRDDQPILQNIFVPCPEKLYELLPQLLEATIPRLDVLDSLKNRPLSSVQILNRAIPEPCIVVKFEKTNEGHGLLVHFHPSCQAYDTFKMLGSYFGYPECCIEAFITDYNDPMRRLRRKDRIKEELDGIGYITCPDCHQKDTEQLVAEITARRICGHSLLDEDEVPEIPQLRAVKILLAIAEQRMVLAA
jgi:hypothetical protein